ncbi:uncharacterized protein DEA37_0009900, partial [Paragonimus westermani]
RLQLGFMPADVLIKLLLRACTGFADKKNDVLFFGRPGPAQANVVYFGGDLQDLEEHMRTHSNGLEYLDWSLEQTGRLLNERLLTHAVNAHVWIVRPSQWIFNDLASFSNFVSVDERGNPLLSTDCPTVCNATEHLAHLITNAVDEVNKQDSRICAGLSNQIVGLIGFSKGCCVLTSIIYDLSVYEPFSNRSAGLVSFSDTARLFLSKIRSIYWLDAGHSAIYHQWPISVSNLASLNPTTCPKLNVYATPYQVANPLRPWKTRDYQTFTQLLSRLQLPHRQAVLLQTEQSNQTTTLPNVSDLRMHFAILKYFPLCGTDILGACD